MANLLQYILFGVAILGIYYVYCGYTESFVSMVAGAFPTSQDNPILEGDYPVKKDPVLSKETYSQMSSNQPITPMSSYEQTTNNFRFWKTPNNGMCSPADFCGALYNKKNILIPNVPKPNDASTRVNYYNIDN